MDDKDIEINDAVEEDDDDSCVIVEDNDMGISTLNEELEKVDNTIFNSSQANIIKLVSPIANNLEKLVGKKAEINLKKGKVAIAIITDDDNDYETSQDITGFDKSVLNAVCTVAFYGFDKFSLNQIYKIVSGSKTPKSPNGKKLVVSEKILYSLRKLNKILIYMSRNLDKKEAVDWNKILKASDNVEDENHNINDLYAIESRLIQYERISATLGGYEQNIFRLLSMPLLLKQAIQYNQLCTIPYEIIELPCSETWQAIVIRDYLISRIESLKNAKNKQYQQTILCQSIYDVVDKSKDKLTDKAINKLLNKKEEVVTSYFESLSGTYSINNAKKRIRGLTEKILDSWKGKNYIKDYSEFKSAQMIKGYKIEFNDDIQAIIDRKINRIK